MVAKMYGCCRKTSQCLSTIHPQSSDSRKDTSMVLNTMYILLITAISPQRDELTLSVIMQLIFNTNYRCIDLPYILTFKLPVIYELYNRTTSIANVYFQHWATLFLLNTHLLIITSTITLFFSLHLLVNTMLRLCRLPDYKPSLSSRLIGSGPPF